MKKLRTYNAWQRRGHQVTRGQKAKAFNDKGKALFSKSQTAPQRLFLHSSGQGHRCPLREHEDYSDFERDMDQDLAQAYGLFY